MLSRELTLKWRRRMGLDTNNKKCVWIQIIKNASTTSAFFSFFFFPAASVSEGTKFTDHALFTYCSQDLQSLYLEKKKY